LSWKDVLHGIDMETIAVLELNDIELEMHELQRNELSDFELDMYELAVYAPGLVRAGAGRTD